MSKQQFGYLGALDEARKMERRLVPGRGNVDAGAVPKQGRGDIWTVERGGPVQRREPRSIAGSEVSPGCE